MDLFQEFSRAPPDTAKIKNKRRVHSLGLSISCSPSPQACVLDSWSLLSTETFTSFTTPCPLLTLLRQQRGRPLQDMPWGKARVCGAVYSRGHSIPAIMATGPRGISSALQCFGLVICRSMEVKGGNGLLLPCSQFLLWQRRREFLLVY